MGLCGSAPTKKIVNPRDVRVIVYGDITNSDYRNILTILKIGEIAYLPKEIHKPIINDGLQKDLGDNSKETPLIE